MAAVFSQFSQGFESRDFPFRKLAVTSFVRGGAALVLAIILLLAMKPALKAGNVGIVAERLAAAVGLLVLGGYSLVRGIYHERKCSLEELYDPRHNNNLNTLLGQRCAVKEDVAHEYARIMHGRAFSLHEREQGHTSKWQSVLYDYIGQGGIAKIITHMPYPIANFIARQTTPFAVLAFFIGLLLAYSLASYLELVPLNTTWLSLFMLTGLLSVWLPSRMSTMLQKHSTGQQAALGRRLLFFAAFYILAINLYKPYATGLSIGLLLSVLAVAAVMGGIMHLSLQLIKSVFYNRARVDVEVSQLDLVSHRAAAQPATIVQQFENVLKQEIGYCFASPVNRKSASYQSGGFEFEHVYETMPEIITNPHSAANAQRLSTIWLAGTGLICLGLLAFFAGVLLLPAASGALLNYQANEISYANSLDLLWSSYLLLFGTATYFLGHKLVYEIYMFFNAEIFFKSKLILLNIRGTSGKAEQKANGVKLTDNFTDFTPDLKVSEIISSVFVNPYLSAEDIRKMPRYILQISRDESLLQEITANFGQNMRPYLQGFIGNGYWQRLKAK